MGLSTMSSKFYRNCCRLCLDEGKHAIDIFVVTGLQEDIEKIYNIKVTPKDPCTTSICVKCYEETLDYIKWAKNYQQQKYTIQENQQRLLKGSYRHSTFERSPSRASSYYSDIDDMHRLQTDPEALFDELDAVNSCPNCHERFPTDKVLKQHMNTVCRRTYECRDCGKVYHNRNNVKRHFTSVHKDKVFSLDDAIPSYKPLLLRTSMKMRSENSMLEARMDWSRRSVQPMGFSVKRKREASAPLAEMEPMLSRESSYDSSYERPVLFARRRRLSTSSNASSIMTNVSTANHRLRNVVNGIKANRMHISIGTGCAALPADFGIRMRAKPFSSLEEQKMRFVIRYNRASDRQQEPPLRFVFKNLKPPRPTAAYGKSSNAMNNSTAGTPTKVDPKRNVLHRPIIKPERPQA